MAQFLSEGDVTREQFIAACIININNAGNTNNAVDIAINQADTLEKRGEAPWQTTAQKNNMKQGTPQKRQISNRNQRRQKTKESHGGNEAKGQPVSKRHK